MVRSSLALVVSAVVAALAACRAPQPPPAPAPRAVTPAPAASARPTLRLPRVFTPARYAARLAIDPGKDAFAGAITIEGAVASPASVIWLHGEKLAIGRAVAVRAGVEVPVAVTAHAPDLLELRPQRALEPGPWALQLDYTAPLDLVNTAGAFKQVAAGHAYVYTQLEAVYARRVFPCLDEPDSKVPWQLTLDVPRGQVAVANTPVAREAALPDGGVRVEFAPSKPLPSYLVAFGVGPFDVVDAGTSQGGTPVRVIALAGRGPDAAHAARTAPRLLDLSEAWFGTPYPYEKLDLLTIPLTVGFGAMENAGLVTFAEELILLGDQPSKQRELWWAQVAAHEFAHQWFGNLVTTAFWDDIWLNEAFASWVEGKIVAEFAPAWRMEGDDVRTRHRALGVDALVSARRVRQPIATPDDILNAFDRITYDKGSAVIAMFEMYLGPAVVQQGVRAYLAARAWGNATSTDFVQALSKAAGRDLGPAFATFLDQPGAPLITAELACGATPTVRLAQRRHVPPGAAAPAAGQPWQVPVCVAYEKGGARAEACTLLDQPTGTLALAAGRCPRWVMPTARGLGYHRVAYTAAQVTALRDEAWTQLTPAERRAVTFDVAEAARTGALPLALALSLVPRLLADGDRYAVEDALALPAALHAHVPAELRPKFEGWLRATFGPAARAAGLVPAATDTLDVEASREELIAMVGATGRDPALRAKAVELAAGWRALPEAVRGLVLRLAVDADAAVFAQALRDVVTEPDKVRREQLYAALGGVREPARLAQALALLTDPRVDLRESIAIVWSLADDVARAQAQAFVREHAAALLARLPADGTAKSAASLSELFTDTCRAEARAEVRAFVTRTFGGLPGSARVLAENLEDMEQCIARRAVLEPQLRAWLGGLKLPKP